MISPPIGLKSLIGISTSFRIVLWLQLKNEIQNRMIHVNHFDMRILHSKRINNFNWWNGIQYINIYVYL